MPTIEVDFETFKAITARRPDETVSEGDVVRRALGLPNSGGSLADGAAGTQFWRSEGVPFQVGTKMRHVFRNGQSAVAEITVSGVKVDGRVFPGLSPAASHKAGYQSNGWQFWEVEQSDGRWVKADALRHS